MLNGISKLVPESREPVKNIRMVILKINIKWEK